MKDHDNQRGCFAVAAKELQRPNKVVWRRYDYLVRQNQKRGYFTLAEVSTMYNYYYYIIIILSIRLFHPALGYYYLLTVYCSSVR